MAAGGDALAEAAATGDDMRCGGCGAKVPAQVLRRVLDRLGIAAEAADDAVLLPSAGAEMLQTADFFRAMLDDPYVFGQIAAVHALGDIYAKAGAPLYALATAGIPHGGPAIMEEDLFQMLSGADAVLRTAGARLVGGHSAELDDLALGFAVTGKVGARTLRKGGLSPGDRLILTKPLGTGAIFAAAMRGEASAAWIDQAIASMLISSATAAQVLLDYRASACTDVTGFGLAGHLAEMLSASRMAADLELDAVPSLPGGPAATRSRTREHPAIGKRGGAGRHRGAHRRCARMATVRPANGRGAAGRRSRRPGGGVPRRVAPGRLSGRRRDRRRPSARARRRPHTPVRPRGWSRYEARPVGTRERGGAMRTATGVVTVAQETRFRLVTMRRMIPWLTPPGRPAGLQDCCACRCSLRSQRCNPT